MGRTQLALRGAIEGLLGSFFLVNVPLQWVRILGTHPAHDYTNAFFAGSALGTLFCLFVGFLLIRDAVHVFKRVRERR